MNMEQVGSMVPLLLFIALVAGCVWLTRRSARQRRFKERRCTEPKAGSASFLSRRSSSHPW